MKMDKIKKALMRGVPAGLLTGVFYGLLRMLYDKMPFRDAFLSRSTILFAAVIVVVEVVVYYVKLSREEKKY